ncbi:MAG: hypothetical protein GXP40_10805 [Chloroflexi bacterium]|nr:hypothetical protein [Chloroflexota bacterium]
MDATPNRLSFRDYPTAMWVFGIVAAGVGIYFYIRNPAQWVIPAIGAGIGLIVFLTSSVLTVQADRITRTLTITRRSLLRRSTKSIPFGDIAAIQIGTSIDDEDGSRTYRVEIVLQDGQVVPLRTYYTSGLSGKEKQAQRLREFIGVGGMDGIQNIGDMLQMASQMAVTGLREEQESITGSQDEERVTNGVRWKLSTLTFGSAPLTRWHSRDYQLPDGFLYLAQTTQNGKGLLDKLARPLSGTLVKHSLKLYGFDVNDIPGVDKAEVVADIPALEPYYFVYASDAYLAQQILNPWTTTPLVDWANRHPLTKANATDQLVILFAPGGVYLSVPGFVNAEYLDELAALGAELVRAQGGGARL